MKTGYEEQLKNPDKGARGKTRWWWYGCRVNREDIVYQLDQMLEAGLGGVEIQILYALESGTRENLEYFSPEFFAILKFTGEEIHKRGMTMDLTLGSSWPFGGPFVPFVKSAPVVHPYSIDVRGPVIWNYDFTNRVAGEIVGCIMGRMENSEMIPESIRDISSKLEEKLLFGWPWGTQIRNLEVPEGDYKIVVFLAGQFREHVLMPSRGADGYVIDHNDREAARFFFEQAGTPLVERLGKGTVNSFFCDSLEIFGHNWTGKIYEEFERRRGYSLKPYIYALWGNIQGITEEIRYDFHKTMSELTIENFFRVMTEWCHEMGSTSRIQAHGTWGDVLEAYGAADIPEGETFYAWDKYSVNTVHRRIASSAGHVYHKKIISNESFTWLRSPRFTETPEQIKIAADSIFVDGMNQIVNHGYTYERREGEGEQLSFYASSHICHTNPWWKYYGKLGRYINRVCDFLQRGEPVSDICIYLPQHDIWAENPLGDIHMCMKLEERLETAVIDRIAQSGYWFDYVNDDVLCRWKEFPYKTLLIMEADRMPEETAESIREFAEAGNLVICADRLPSKGCGYQRGEDKGRRIADIFLQMTDKGLIYLAENKRDALLMLLEEKVHPDLKVEKGAEDIGYVHRRDKKADIYFVANMSQRDWDTRLSVYGERRAFCILDPMEGKAVCPRDYERTEKGTDIEIHFLQGQSFLLIFDSELPESEKDRNRLIWFDTKELNSKWHLEVPEKNFSCYLEKLEGFEKLEELKYYSGEAVYRTEINMSARDLSADCIILEAEQVGCAAGITVNGLQAGQWIQKPYVLNIKEYLHTGRNEIKICVSNLLINRVLDPAWKVEDYQGTVIDEWPYFTEPLNKERRRRLSNRIEKELIKEPFPSGLIGKAKLRLCHMEECSDNV